VTQPTLIPAIRFSPAKARLSELLTEVVHHHAPRVIERHRGKESAILLRSEDLLAILESEHRLSVEVAVEEESVTAAIAELGVLGLGSTIAEAMDDLRQELRRYVADYVDRLGFYLQTDRARHAAAVVRLALTPEEDWAQLLVDDSRATDTSQATRAEAATTLAV
jgi:PHD/YefM family antitoxin component YafN of YafNO toxin-antitoxin module